MLKGLVVFMLTLLPEKNGPKKGPFELVKHFTQFTQNILNLSGVIVAVRSLIRKNIIPLSIRLYSAMVTLSIPSSSKSYIVFHHKKLD